MFIQTEDTPNPLTVKFLPGREVLGQGTASYVPDDIGSAPLMVQKLLTISGVVSVFLSSDFISVTKAADADWSLLRPHILGAIMDYYSRNADAPIDADVPAAQKPSYDPATLTQIEKDIIELLDTRVRPAVAQDGGDIVFDRFEEGVVYVHLQGACSGCPSSTLTLKSGVENMLRHYIPEVEEVRAV